MPKWNPAKSIQGLFQSTGQPKAAVPPPIGGKPVPPPIGGKPKATAPTPPQTTAPANEPTSGSSLTSSGRAVDEKFSQARNKISQWWQPLSQRAKSGVSVGGIVLVLLLLRAMFGGGGSITFAEEVDFKTFETTNEGTEFTTGQVNMIIRGDGAFGDTRLIVSFNKDEEVAWQILGEYPVDAEWDIVAVPIQLRDPGNYEIVVKTSSGTIIAQNSVRIIR
jgi:hypothetical protein